MTQTGIRRVAGTAALAACLGAVLPVAGWAQATKAAVPTAAIEQPDAQRTKQELENLLERYPPSVRRVLALDPGLLNNQAYMAPYPALAGFLGAHPDIARNPEFYIGDAMDAIVRPNRDTAAMRMWQDVLSALGVFAGFAMAIGLLTWLIRTTIDYRRWSRLTRVQTEVHTKLLDRFTGREDLMAYIQSPAGAKFLEASPINLDAGPRSVGAPLGRILWTGQAGLVLAAVGIGLQIVSGQVAADAAQPLHALGVLGIALGLGLVISAIISYIVSQRLGLIERAAPRAERQGGLE